MGEKGKVSRILARAWGSWAVYAPSTLDAQTAPGQLLLSELTDLYRYAELDASTPLYGILGHPVSESLSPLLHNTAYARRGLKGCFLPFDAEVVAELAEGARTGRAIDASRLLGAERLEAIRAAAHGADGDLVAVRKRLSFPAALAEIRLALL